MTIRHSLALKHPFQSLPRIALAKRQNADCTDVPIDPEFRNKLKVSGSHDGHLVWIPRTDIASTVHGTIVGVHIESCVGCLKCISACPVAVFVPWTDNLGRTVVDPARETECMNCLLCEIVCPTDAISIQRDPGSTETLDSLLHDV